MTKKLDPFECNCPCHTTPGIMHCVPCCDRPPYQPPEDMDEVAEHIQHLLARQSVNASARYNEHGIMIGQVLVGHFIKATTKRGPKAEDGVKIQGVVKGVFTQDDEVPVHTGASEFMIRFEDIEAVVEPKTVFESIQAGLLDAISQSENKNRDLPKD